MKKLVLIVVGIILVVLAVISRVTSLGVYSYLMDFLGIVGIILVIVGIVLIFKKPKK